eukprot:947858-Prymnesium_polylepis.1
MASLRVCHVPTVCTNGCGRRPVRHRQRVAPTPSPTRPHAAITRFNDQDMQRSHPLDGHARARRQQCNHHTDNQSHNTRNTRSRSDPWAKSRTLPVYEIGQAHAEASFALVGTSSSWTSAASSSAQALQQQQLLHLQLLRREHVSSSSSSGTVAAAVSAGAPPATPTPGATTDRARMMLTGGGVNVTFTPMESLLQAVP